MITEPFEGFDPDNLYPGNAYGAPGNITYEAEAIGEWLWERLKPRSVIDLGCGPGCYLLPYKRHGAEILGVDACPECGHLIPGDFKRVDLRLPYTPPKRYDLAICIEVGEHLEAEYADVLIQSIVGCSDIVLFGAAVPGQTGQYHVNEQPPAYWLAKWQAQGYAQHALQPEMRAFLRSLTPESAENPTGCHVWLREHSYLLEARA
jgi:SAM-dependent methyltransferase